MQVLAQEERKPEMPQKYQDPCRDGADEWKQDTPHTDCKDGLSILAAATGQPQQLAQIWLSFWIWNDSLVLYWHAMQIYDLTLKLTP